MSLNISKGNMYKWVTHTWNTIKGACPHDCSYCYMKRWGDLKPVRFDEKELKTDLGKDNFIFVGSSCDMFANDISSLWIARTLEYCKKCYANSYLFQSKNPERFFEFVYPGNTVFCITLETNRWYPDYMVKAPPPLERALRFSGLVRYSKYITIEPIMDFDLDNFVSLIRACNPKQVNIGADSGKNNLPEPKPEKINDLINELESFTRVKRKKNLNRLFKKEYML